MEIHEKGILGFTIIPAQPDIPILTEHKVNKKKNKYGHRPYVYPIEFNKNKFFYIIQQIFRKFWKNCRKYTDGNNKN